jgi:hypothetical protein
VYCVARVGGRKLRLYASPEPGRASCLWSIPRGAAGQILEGSIGVNENGGPVVTRRFSGRVIEVGAHLSVEGGVSTAPRQPISGQRFYYAMGVAVEHGGQHRRIRSGSVTCRALVGDRAAPVVEELVRRDSGVRCGWLIPAGMSGRPMLGVIVVRSEGGVLAHRFTRRVR